MKKVIFICFILLAIPKFSDAAITINEIAWMGNETSANDEWIELYNTGSQSVDVEGWMLSDGMNLEITLTGAIGAGQYAVLERTDDNSAPGTAFLIYTGALSNGGVTLSLYRADSSIEDRIVGGENWQNIGGDNVTKETAQYTSAGWITAEATPGATNASEASATQNTDTIPDTTNTTTDNNSDYTNTSSGASNTTTLHTTPRTLILTLDAPTRAYVNQAVRMEIVPSGLAKGILQSVQYTWNLGDLSVTTGREITTRYAYPGEYVITANGMYKKYEASVRKTITVLPVAFSMTLSPKGEIQVHNNARYEVDISQYRLISDSILVFPEGTILLPNATITIPKDKLQYRARVVLYDETATEVSRFATPVTSENATILSTTQSAPLVRNTNTREVSVRSQEQEEFTFVSQDTTVPEIGTIQTIPTTTSAQEVMSVSATSVGNAAPSSPLSQSQNQKLPYFLLLAVIAVGIFGAFIGRAR